MKGGLQSAGEDRPGTRSKEARQNRQFQAGWRTLEPRAIRHAAS
jgi:hypothetical protein